MADDQARAAGKREWALAYMGNCRKYAHNADWDFLLHVLNDDYTARNAEHFSQDELAELDSIRRLATKMKTGEPAKSQVSRSRGGDSRIDRLIEARVLYS